jgi:hypothetical protein
MFELLEFTVVGQIGFQTWKNREHGDDFIV